MAACFSELTVQEMGDLRVALPDVACFGIKTTPESNSSNWAESLAARFIQRPPLEGWRRAGAKLKRLSQCGKLPIHISKARFKDDCHLVASWTGYSLRLSNLMMVETLETVLSIYFWQIQTQLKKLDSNTYSRSSSWELPNLNLKKTWTDAWGKRSTKTIPTQDSCGWNNMKHETTNWAFSRSCGSTCRRHWVDTMPA